MKLDKDNFERETNVEGQVLLLFHADWASPSHALIEQLEAMEIEFALADVVELPQQAFDYDIKAVPTLIMLEDGVEIKRKIGFDPERTVEEIF